MLVILVATVGLAGPAVAAGNEITPTYKMQDTWFQCGDQRVWNVNANNGIFPTWSTTSPSQAFVGDAAGCGYYDNLVSLNNAVDAIWAGKFVGNLKAMTVNLHNIYAASDRTTGKFRMSLLVKIDGAAVIDTGSTVFSVPTRAENQGVTDGLFFSLVNLPHEPEDGDGTTSHDIVIRASGFNEIQSFWAWGTTEAPSGVTFNPAVLEPTQLSGGA